MFAQTCSSVRSATRKSYETCHRNSKNYLIFITTDSKWIHSTSGIYSSTSSNKRNNGILLDSTPDISHREQISQVIRYVEVELSIKKVSIKGSFLGFIDIHAKKAGSIENTILVKLNSHEISLTNCRSQCFDNAAVMAGHISGVQQKIIVCKLW